MAHHQGNTGRSQDQSKRKLQINSEKWTFQPLAGALQRGRTRQEALSQQVNQV